MAATILRHPILYGLVLLAYPVTRALTAQPPAQEMFGARIEVRVVNIEAIVTDASGRRVSGLRREDFRLRVDGQEVDVGYFTEVYEGQTLQVASAPGTIETVSEPKQTVPTNYLVFVDRMWGFAADQERLLLALTRQLSRLRPVDRVAVVAYGGGNLETLTGWTGSRSRAEAALREALAGEFEGMRRFVEEWQFRRDAITRRRYEQEASAEGDQGIQPFQENPDRHHFLNRVYHQMDLISRAVAATMQGFANRPGRKVMLLFSGGWVEEFPPYLTDGSPRKLLFRITDTANLLGFTLYPVDALMDRFGWEREHHAVLDFLAENTGGRALADASGLRALETAAADSSSYYWLGFAPTWNGDARSRKIDLEVLKPGLSVRTGSRFRDVSRESEVSELLETAALLGGVASTSPLELAFGAPERARRKRVKVPLTITIPMDGVTGLSGPQGHTFRLEIRIAALDEGGDLNDVPVIPLSFSNPEPPQSGQFVRYETDLVLRQQDHEVVVAVYDLASGAILSGRRKLDL